MSLPLYTDILFAFDTRNFFTCSILFRILGTSLRRKVREAQFYIFYCMEGRKMSFSWGRVWKGDRSKGQACGLIYGIFILLYITRQVLDGQGRIWARQNKARSIEVS